MSRDIRLEIVEQPKQRGMRFRYECEGRSAGSIPGENTTNDKKTWPSCQISNYQGMAVIRVSLVSKDDPPRPHPHSLVGRDCDKGICQINVDHSSQMQGLFPNLGIQCVRRKEVSTAIHDRLQLGVNPFNATVNGDERSAIDVDLNIVRLCFEAFLPDRNGNFTQKLQPVVSNPIYDKKAPSSSLLKICRVDKTAGSVLGKEEVFLLCDKVQKEDIQVVFSHKGWEALGDFSSPDVHRQVAIVFKTPPYHDEHIQQNVDVEMKLRRPSDMETSAPLIFTYIPVQQGLPYNKPFPPNMFLPRSNQFNTNPRIAIIRRTNKRINQSSGADRIPLKRPHPLVTGPSMDPRFVPPFPTQRPPSNRHPFPYHRQQVLWPSSFVQRPAVVPQSNVKSETDYQNSPFPQSQLLPSEPATNMVGYPTLVNPTISSQQNQINDVPLDSLPSLGPDGTIAVLNDSTLPLNSVATNFPKLEEPQMGSEFALNLHDLLQQHCSIEEPEGDKSLMKMLESDGNYNITTLLAQDGNNLSHQTNIHELPPSVPAVKQLDPRLFNTTADMSPHHITSSLPHQPSSMYSSQHVSQIMSPSPMTTTLPPPSPMTTTLPLHPSPMTSTLPPHPSPMSTTRPPQHAVNVMSPNPRHDAPHTNSNPLPNVGSPHVLTHMISDSMAQVHQTMALSPEPHVPAMTPQTSAFYQPQNIQQTEPEQNDQGDFSGFPPATFNLVNNTNNNNYLSSDTREDSIDKLLKSFPG